MITLIGNTIVAGFSNLSGQPISGRSASRVSLKPCSKVLTGPRIGLWLLAVSYSCCVWCSPLPHDERVPGGVAVVPLAVTAKAAPTVHFDHRHVMVLSHDNQWFAIVGIPLDTTPGDHALEVSSGSEAPVPVRFDVRPKNYPVQRLTIKNPQLVNPTPAEMRRILREQKHLNVVFARWRRDASPSVDFIWPAKGPETSPFGIHRFLNGEAHGQHSGIDIGAPYAGPVQAPADAVVADVGTYYFCGKTLTLDMGQGLLSVFCHLSRIDVKPGQLVKQGQIVGRIGKTGRTTGPNLHWTVRLNDTIVDPHAFLPVRP